MIGVVRVDPEEVDAAQTLHRIDIVDLSIAVDTAVRHVSGK